MRISERFFSSRGRTLTPSRSLEEEEEEGGEKQLVVGETCVDKRLLSLELWDGLLNTI